VVDVVDETDGREDHLYIVETPRSLHNASPEKSSNASMPR